MRIGFGYDVHQLVYNRDLILGGVKIPFDRGLLGHSDADVLVHAVMDSILGALAQGDIGKLFPDTDLKYKDISSLVLLAEVKTLMDAQGYELGNLDVTVAAEMPKLAPYIDEMRGNIGQVLDADLDRINIKATTTERLGFVGQEAGMEAYAVTILKKLTK